MELGEEAKPKTVSRSDNGIRGTLGLFDQVPELRIILELGVFVAVQVRAEQKVFQGVFAKNAMNDDPEWMTFKIDPIITQAIPEEDSSDAGQPPKISAFALNFRG